MTELNKLILPDNVQVADHMPLIYTPDFWDPRKAYADYSPDIEGAFIEGFKCRKKLGLRTAAELIAAGISNGMMLTDLQGDFRDGGRLPVIGTNDVVLRVCARLVNGLVTDYYTLLVDSQDGHPPFHISYATRWLTQNGEPFDLRGNKAAMLSLEDERRGIFRATCFSPVDGSPIDMGYIQSMFNVKDTVAYWNHLQATDQGPVWVFANHCKLGTDGTNLHPLVAEVLAFAEGARMIEPVPVFKGHIRDTDWFGPLEPCRPDSSHPQGGFQKHIVDLFARVTGCMEFAGVAEDFCEHNMERQTLRFFEGTQFFKQMAFMTDGTAAIVPNAPHVLQLRQEARSKGVKFFTHDEQF